MAVSRSWKGKGRGGGRREGSVQLGRSDDCRQEQKGSVRLAGVKGLEGPVTQGAGNVAWAEKEIGKGGEKSQEQGECRAPLSRGRGN